MKILSLILYCNVTFSENFPTKAGKRQKGMKREFKEC